MLVEFKVYGKAGHAASYPENGSINAIYRASDIINNYIPEVLNYAEHDGTYVKFNIISINSGTQHNVIPDLCIFKAIFEIISSIDGYIVEDVIDTINDNIPEGWCDINIIKE